MIDYNQIAYLLEGKKQAEIALLLHNFIKPELSRAYFKGRTDQELNLPYDEEYTK